MWFRRLRCSFCRRSDKDVAKLVAGASGYICDRCAYETIASWNDAAGGNDAGCARNRVADARLGLEPHVALRHDERLTTTGLPCPSR